MLCVLRFIVSLPALAFLFAFIASTLALWQLIPMLRSRFLDTPNKRSSHQRPTPRGGGLIFVLLSIFASVNVLLSGMYIGSNFAMLLLLASPLAIVGMLDDTLDLSPGLRYFFQLFTSSLIVFLSPLPIAMLFFPVLIVAVTAVINFVNFMDGIDGLVAGCMALTTAALSIAMDAPWSLWALVGSLLGFLVWNWSPAKVFMGDVGSTFLGAVFAGMVLQASSWREAFGYLLVATPLLADACLCVLRRLFAGQRVFEAHRLHLFQRLHQAGWPHARVSLSYIASTAVLAVAMLTGGLLWVLSLAIAVLLIGVWLDQRVAVPFAAASKS